MTFLSLDTSSLWELSLFYLFKQGILGSATGQFTSLVNSINIVFIKKQVHATIPIASVKVAFNWLWKPLRWTRWKLDPMTPMAQVQTGRLKRKWERSVCTAALGATASVCSELSQSSGKIGEPWTSSFRLPTLKQWKKHKAWRTHASSKYILCTLGGKRCQFLHLKGYSYYLLTLQCTQSIFGIMKLQCKAASVCPFSYLKKNAKEVLISHLENWNFLSRQ